MGLKPVIYRYPTHAVNRRGSYRIGYTGAVANSQFDYDHRQDGALFLDQDFVQKRLRALQTSYEKYKELAAVHTQDLSALMYLEKRRLVGERERGMAVF